MVKLTLTPNRVHQIMLDRARHDAAYAAYDLVAWIQSQYRATVDHDSSPLPELKFANEHDCTVFLLRID